MRSLVTTGVRFRIPWQTTVMLSVGLSMMPFVMIPLLARGPLSVVPFVSLLGIALLAFGGAVAAMRRDRFRSGGSVTLTAHGLEVLVPQHAAPLVVARGEVIAGYTVPLARSVELRLTGGRRLEVETSEPAALLEHLGVAVNQRALTMPLRGMIGAFTLGLMTTLGGVIAFGVAYRLGLVALLGASGMAVMWPFTLLSTLVAVVLVVRRFGFPRVVVGADGVSVRGTIAQPFVPYGAIANVRAHPSGVQIALRDGEFVQLETIGQTQAQITTLAARIDQGRSAAFAEASAPLDALQRGERPIPAWLADVRRIAVAPPGFRDHAYSRDDFERILTDASAPPDQRVGAALALRFADPEARPRIRVAAAASANDDLRTALEACAADEEALDEAPLERVTRRAR